jgi:hypothetical protein
MTTTPTTPAENLLAATKELHEELTNRLRQLESFTVLASLGPLTAKQTMMELETQLEEIENATLDLNRIVDREATFVQRALQHVERWNQIKIKASNIQSHLVSNNILPQPTTTSTNDFSMHNKPLSTTIISSSNKLNNNNTKSSSETTSSPKTTTNILIPPNQSMFNTVPRYVQSKLTFENLTHVVEVFNQAVTRKQDILTPSSTSIQQQHHQKVLVHKWIDQARLLNLPPAAAISFISEDDLLELAPNHLSLEIITAALRVLRHLGKIRSLGNGAYTVFN